MPVTFMMFEVDGKKILLNPDLVDVLPPDEGPANHPLVVFRTAADNRLNFPKSCFNEHALQAVYRDLEQAREAMSASSSLSPSLSPRALQMSNPNPPMLYGLPLVAEFCLLSEESKAETLLIANPDTTPQCVGYLACSFADMVDVLRAERHRIVDVRPQPHAERACV